MKLQVPPPGFELSFHFKTDCVTKVKVPNMPDYLFLAEGRSFDSPKIPNSKVKRN